ncbi:MAG: hypothetical protein QHH18_05470 [Candidatus Bathyarchaeota archaeon]|jgi:hypothetical protein|nr:hypothetical protein [Candidatus Bathyarchaeota archaeon A05DMB-5]MDH7558038.1 hypothetical protein [Candidatus Bathyarchaeota archaeon]
MLIRKKEIVAAVALCTTVLLLTIYLSTRHEQQHSASLYICSENSGKDFRSIQSISPTSQVQYQVITETIEGELEKGAFEDAVDRLTVLADEKDGYVKSLHMTYQNDAWSGQMLCKIPPANVTSFTFNARAIIDLNGTVTYINISVETVNASDITPEEEFSSITINLKEKKPSDASVDASLEPVVKILSASILWIAQGLIVVLPLCFVSLGIVLLFNRGIIPVWRNVLKGSKQTPKKETA